MSWELASFAVLGIALAAGFGWYERSRPSARVLSLVAALAALAVVGRIAFAPFPNVKPTTDIVLFAGYVLGGAPGFAVGATTALASNFFFSQGPWTPWQMAAWGAVGILGAALARGSGDRELGRWPLALACGAAGLGFGLVMDAYQWTLAADQSVASYVAVSGTSLPYNLAHAFGNVAFCLLVGPPFVRALGRYRRRFDFSWPVARPGVAGLLAVATLAGLLLSSPPPAEGATAAQRAARFLRVCQNADGGFGADRGASSSALYTGWAGLGLASAGRNPRDVRRRKRSIVDYIRRHAGSLNDTGELERTILVLKAAGLSPRRFAGRNLVRRLRSRRRPNGSFGGLVNHTAFGVMALRAAGERRGSRGMRRSARWMIDTQNGDGGFGFAPRAASDVDDTAAVLEALGSLGRRRARPVRRGIGYLRSAQNRDGGFGQSPARSSNAQSTAWAVQGLVAAGRDPGRVRRAGRSPLRYLRSLQARSGRVRYSRTSSQTPVWVTAQALSALKRKPFPLRTVRRKPRRVRTARPGGASGEAAARGSGARRSPGAPGSPSERSSVAGTTAKSSSNARSAGGSTVAGGGGKGALRAVKAVSGAELDPAAAERLPVTGALGESGAGGAAALGGGGALLAAVLWWRRRARRAGPGP